VTVKPHRLDAYDDLQAPPLTSILKRTPNEEQHTEEQ